MKGLMYIAGSFHTVRRNMCGGGKSWIDNDPHFWTQPPTWGICRNDLRRRADEGDFVFFVLPKASVHPQSIFGYLKIDRKITHAEAYARPDLRTKRMGNKVPNGNIIVDAAGRYNRYDAGAHRHIFEKVKRQYAVGNPAQSRFLSATEIDTLAPTFPSLLRQLFGGAAATPFAAISRYGATLTESQAHAVIRWIED